MEKLTKKDKQIQLAILIELMVKAQYDITEMIGKPITHFNYTLIKYSIQALQKELNINI